MCHFLDDESTIGTYQIDDLPPDNLLDQFSSLSGWIACLPRDKHHLQEDHSKHWEKTKTSVMGERKGTLPAEFPGGI